MVAMAGGRLVIDWASELELMLVPYVARWTKTFRGPRSTVCVHSSRSKGRHDIDVTDHVDDETLTSFGRPSLSQLNFFSCERVHGRVHLRKRGTQTTEQR